jgi:hypothetical protein
VAAIIQSMEEKTTKKATAITHQKRPFTRAQLRRFMFMQSKAYPVMIKLVRKPDGDNFRLALDIFRAPAQQVVYFENTPMFVRIALPRARSWLRSA